MQDSSNSQNDLESNSGLLFFGDGALPTGKNHKILSSSMVQFVISGKDMF